MQCPKCRYEPTMAESQRSPDECVKCGIVYAKFLAKVEAPAAAAVGKVTFADWLNSNPYAKWLIALGAGLVIGYFAGREHVKYELRSALSDSLSGLSAAFGGQKSKASKNSSPTASPAPAPNKAAPVKGSLLLKSFYEGEYGQDQITFDLIFKNDGVKDIRAFDGVLEFSDLLGNPILSSKIAINDAVKVGQSLPWSGGIDYNQFMDRHQRLKAEAQENIKMDFVLKKVLYTDGKIEEF